MSLARNAKRAAQVIASIAGPHRWAQNNRLLVLMYHRILPKNDPRFGQELPGMVVDPETFRMHIQTLRKHFTLMHLGDWVERINRGESIPRKACAITFDDGWQDNFEYAFPVLLSEQAPATIFLVSDLVGTMDTLWYRKVARIVQRTADHGTIEPEVITFFTQAGAPADSDLHPQNLDHLIGYLKPYDDRELDKQATKVLRLIGANKDALREILDWEEVRKMAKSGIVEMGSHTRHHFQLRSTLEEDTLREEIITSKQAINEKINGEVRLFCYPNGVTSPEADVFVRQNYLAACTTEKGWHSTTSDHHRIHRIGVHQDIASDKTSFLARLSGWV
jgi:peptidoglycan/xylan/chitin deacetylase (PgdA/CDA1 family)